MKKNGAIKHEAAPAQQLTELEQLKMENYALRYQTLQQQLQTVIADRAAFVRKIEADHPGCSWDEQRGLVAAPQERPQA